MAPDRDQLHAMSRKDKENFKEYAQRWHEIAAQVSPPLEEKEMKKLFLKMLSAGEGRLKEGGSIDSSKKYGSGLSKKKEHNANTISQEKHMRLMKNNQHHQHVAFVTPIINYALIVQVAPSYQPRFQQRTNQQNQQNCAQRPAQLDPIPITYTELFPSLIQKNLVQIRTPPVISKKLPWCATVNMIEGCPGKCRVFDVNLIRRSLVEMHTALCDLSYYEHDHAFFHVCSRDPQGCVVVKRDLQEMLDPNLIQKIVISPLVIRLVGPTYYESDKVVPYKYNVTMVEDDKEVPIPAFSSIMNIADVSGVTRSGWIFVDVSPKRNEDVVIEKSTQEKTPIIQAIQTQQCELEC
ncbi:uncharacterized protein LOC127130337 [Lathyrus oleraceus]|uniref:uncharacterized protein LOC127130337 n=1 Tax=Pisum sativum TaxID=3888 RepID=UPI0021D19B91|nr:uncharacterized protein LOC127130337 [Pisum sativum]